MDLVNAIVIVLFLLTTRTESMGRNTETAPTVCVLSGKVVNFDTGKPVPYFHLSYFNGNGVLIEHLETDEQGNFRVTAPRNSRRYFKFTPRQKRGTGTYIIDWDEQRQIASQLFRGVVRDNMTNLIFKVKLWPVKVLTGKVLDKTGRAIDNALVYIHSDVPAVKTDATGTFKIQVAPTDRDFDLFAISEDMNQAGLVRLKAGTTTATIRLESTASYTGRVIDIKGQAVGPFKFTLGLRLNGSRSDCPQEQIQANIDGTFTLDYLYPKVSYRAWWFPDEQINRTIGEHGEQSIDLRKYKPDEQIEIFVEQYLNKLSGRVINTKGEPIEGAKIMVLTKHGIQAQHRRYKAVNSSDGGEFNLQNLSDGEVLFNVYAKGYKSRRVWAPTDSVDLEITLKTSSDMGICEVWVVDDEHQPIPNAPVNLNFSVIESGKPLTSHTATTNAEGKAEFRVKDFGNNIRARGIIYCDLDGYDLAFNSASDNSDAQVKLVLHKRGEYWSGKIVDPRRNPIARAKLYLKSMAQRVKTPARKTVQSLNQSFFSEASELTLLAQTDENGDFLLKRFNKKDFVRITVKTPGYKSQDIDFSPEHGISTISNSGTFTKIKDGVFQLSTGVAIVKGILIDDSSGKPLPDATVQLRADNNLNRDVITNEQGAFFIEDLEPGEYVPVLKKIEDGTDKNLVCVPDIFTAEAGKTIQVILKAQEGILLKGHLIESKTQKRPTDRRVYIDARLKTCHMISSDSVAKDGSWELLLAPGDYDFYCSIFIEDIPRFKDTDKPLSMTIEKGQKYNNLVLEISDQGSLLIQPLSLVNRPMPELEDFKLNISPADVNNKMILVCFFDMNQRPSRNCLRQLSSRAQELKAKDIVVVAVQASKIDENTLNEWTKENDIPFPVGMIQGDDEKIHFAWGVQSLPWLILTDKKHNVRLEGFSINELNEELSKEKKS
jgi:hypothetical protein